MADYIIPETYQKFDRDGTLLWINFEAREFESQSGYARGSQSISTGSRLGSWRLLAPTEIQESISHDWGEYESIGSRIAQKMGEIKRSIGEVKGLTSSFAKAIKGGMSTLNAKNLANSIAAGAATVPVPKFKVDTSMVYQNSKRREYTFVFQFATTIRGAQREVFEPIRELERLSCAEIGSQLALIDIKFPAVFRVYSEPAGIIKINHAAVTAVQPTWKAPFIKGYPMTAEVQVTIMDIEPLYRKSFKQGGLIRTGEVEAGTGQIATT